MYARGNGLLVPTTRSRLAENDNKTDTNYILDLQFRRAEQHEGKDYIVF